MYPTFLTIRAILAIAGLAAAAPASCPPLPQPAYTSLLPSCPILQRNGIALPRGEIAQVLASLPKTIPKDTTALADIEHIRSTISRYAVAIDGRNFPVLDTVFTTTAQANYSEVGYMDGVEQIKAKLQAGLAPFALTQHNIGTSVIQLCRESSSSPQAQAQSLSAVSVTYVLATHYPGPSNGWPGIISPLDVAVVPVMYQDSWAREVDRSGNVAWKIKGRYLLYQVSVADQDCGVCISTLEKLAPTKVACTSGPIASVVANGCS